MAIIKANRHLTATQMQPLLPERNVGSIQRRRERTGYLYIRTPAVPRVSKPPKLARVGHPVIDAIITRCEQDGISLLALDREIGGGHYFSHKRTTFLLEPIAKAIAFFGGRGLMIDENATVTIDWNDE